MMRPFQARPFYSLLIALLVLVVLYPMLHKLPGSREIFDVMRTAVLLSALWVVFAGRGQRLLGLVLAVVLVPAIWLGYVYSGESALTVTLVLHGVSTAFLVVAACSILWTVFRRPVVSADSVAGALCAYLLLGVVFAYCFWFIETTRPGSIRGQGVFGADLGDPQRSLFVLTYYSFVTITSLGATDVAPASAAAHGVTMVEAITGQFYMAVLIADLIGKRLAGLSPRGPGRADGPPGPPVAANDGRMSAE